MRKAVKLALLLKNKIRFTEHKVGEEAIYSFLLMHYAESFSFISGSVHEYVNRAGSQSDTKTDDPWGDVAIDLKEKVLQMGLYEQYANTVNAFMATVAIVSLDKIAGKYKWSDYRFKAKNRVRRYKQERDSNYPVDINHMNAKAKVLYPFIKAGFITPIYFASCMNRMRRK